MVIIDTFTLSYAIKTQLRHKIPLVFLAMNCVSDLWPDLGPEWRSLPAGPAVEMALPALEDGALDDLAAVRAGDLPHQVLQQHQASAGHLLTWPTYCY